MELDVERSYGHTVYGISSMNTNSRLHTVAFQESTQLKIDFGLLGLLSTLIKKPNTSTTYNISHRATHIKVSGLTRFYKAFQTLTGDWTKLFFNK